MIRYYLMSLLVLIGACFQSCGKISKSEEFNFIEVNAILIDSIHTVQTQNNELYNALRNDESNNDRREEVIRMRQIINSLNNSIITVKDHIVNESKHASDKVASQKILLEENNANLLLEIANEARNALLSLHEGMQVQDNIQLFPNSNETPEGESWDEYHFKEMPLYAVVAMMNRWVLYNEKIVQRILLTL